MAKCAGLLGVLVALGCGGGGGSADAPPATADAARPDAVAGCPAATGPGTTHDALSIDDATTWTADGNPHLVVGDVFIYATLTLEPCVEVVLDEQAIVTIDDEGALVARGEAGREVTIRGAPGAPWGYLRAAGGRIDLEHTIVRDGGVPQSVVAHLAASIEATGVASAPTQPVVRVSHVRVEGSASNGVLLTSGAGFTDDSEDLTVTGSEAHPIHIWSRAAGTVPSGVYTGNGVDEILLSATGLAESVTESTTFHARGVPYRVGHPTSPGTLYVAGPDNLTPAVLTLEPGVTLRFKEGGVLYVEAFTGAEPASGALVAVGTGAAPIVFESAAATPAAGDWLGIWFGKVPLATNVMTYTRVAHAGGANGSGGDACPSATGFFRAGAIRIFGLPDGGQFVTMSEIAQSAGVGIDRSWRSDSKPDFDGTNTFTDVAGCRQSYPRDTSGACPDPAAVPCP